MSDNKTPKHAHSELTHTSHIIWDENGLPTSSQFDDVYFSKLDGIAESRYVFLQGNHLDQRWSELRDNDVFVIAETGFGTGLNFLLTWQAWEQHPNTKGAHLHFISVEKYPLSRADLSKALALWPQLASYAHALVKAYPPQPAQGQHQLQFNNENITLTLCFNDAHAGLSQLLPTEQPGPKIKTYLSNKTSNTPYVNAWYLDGFTPARNPEMWHEGIFDVMQLLSTEGTTVATFTAASAVRKSLARTGFNCEKMKGFGSKREMLIGKFVPAATQPAPHEQKQQQPIDHFRDYKQQRVQASPSWHVSENYAARPKHCVVIGGGLAGCHTAFALAQKNIRVTLLEKNNALASEASGNRQGIVYAKMSLHPSPLNHFIHAALLFATRFYQQHQCYTSSGDACGVLHLASSPALRKQYHAFCQHFADEPNFVQWLDAEQCETVTGLHSHTPGLFLPQTGWLSPAALCEQLCQHPLIDVTLNSQVTALRHHSNLQNQNHHNHSAWEVTLGDHAVHADTVVLANAHSAKTFEASSHLPLKSIRGQVSHVPASTASQALRAVICGEGYIAPSQNGLHSAGASFNLHHHDSAMRTEDHRDNLAKLVALSPDLNFPELTPATLRGKVGFRCTTPDYFPVVGPVPDVEGMRDRFGFLRKKANAVIDQPGAYHPQLYVNVGHGSRGLCYTPLCAALLAAQISGDFLPIEASLHRFLHPTRFIIRDLMRNKNNTTKQS